MRERIGVAGRRCVVLAEMGSAKEWMVKGRQGRKKRETIEGE